MNGQLAGGPIPSAVQRDCYRGMLNSMLAAGLKTNWWLNWSAIEPDHLKAVNEPARRFGPLFLAMRPDRHDVALLWSQSEIMMRCKPLVARAAHLTRVGIKDWLERVKQLPASSGMDGTTMGFGHYDHGALKGRFLVLRSWRDGKSVQVEGQ